MAKTRRRPQGASTPAPVPTSAFLDDMRALVTTPNPDAGLLLACDRYQLLWEEASTLYRRRARGYLDRIRETAAERDALEAEIASTPARTPTGRRAKAEVGLSKLQGTGIAKIAHSALSDFINAGASAIGGQG